MSISTFIQRNKLLKKRKAEFSTEETTISQKMQNNINLLKVDRDLECILHEYYDTEEYKEFQIIFDKKYKTKVIEYLEKYGIQPVEMAENRVLIVCQ